MGHIKQGDAIDYGTRRLVKLNDAYMMERGMEKSEWKRIKRKRQEEYVLKQATYDDKLGRKKNKVDAVIFFYYFYMYNRMN